MKTALTEICSFLDSYGFNYGLIGGLAISIHGIPRETKLDWDYLERQIKTYRLEDEWTIAQKWTK